MIFVVLGIIILVVSFVVALASLTREQKKLGQKPDNNSDLPDAVKTSTVKVKDKKESPQAPKKLADDVQLKKANKNITDTANNEPFPWEQGEKKDDKEVKTDKTIEQIQAELARIKANRTDSPAEEPQIDSKASKEPTRGDLSGEISLEELKKGL